MRSLVMRVLGSTKGPSVADLFNDDGGFHTSGQFCHVKPTLTEDLRSA